VSTAKGIRGKSPTVHLYLDFYKAVGQGREQSPGGIRRWQKVSWKTKTDVYTVA